MHNIIIAAIMAVVIIIEAAVEAVDGLLLS
jgi:hypothetical protein